MMDNIVQSLFSRDIGKRIDRKPLNDMYCPSVRQLDCPLKKIAELTEALKVAMSRTHKWQEVEYVVGQILSQLLETGDVENMYKVSPQRRQEREFFIQIGGLEQMMQLFRKPWGDPDARTTSQTNMQKRSELWNEILVVLREVTFALPNSAINTFGTNQIVYLFTLLSHASVFENTVNLLEEILSISMDTFYLALVPDFGSLVSKFTSRQLAHFCRILSLVLFEPEDRQLMDGSRDLRSLELIRLRREKMAKINSIVDKNQALVIAIPGLMARFVRIMSITQYAPPLKELLTNNLLGPNIIPMELLHIITGDTGAAEWDIINELDGIVVSERANRVQSANENQDAARTIEKFWRQDQADDKIILTELMGFFGTRFTAIDMPSLAGVVNLAQSLGMGKNNRNHNNNNKKKSYRDAKRNLMFQALLVTPHLIEVVFVLCTMLSGRRKLDVQNTLLRENLATVLPILFDRMSWGEAIACYSTNSEEAHGPGCVCTPESALRVQLLRLIHNFYDRDFCTNPIKYELLSRKELEVLSVESGEAMKTGFYIPLEQQGLLCKIMGVLQKEPADSLYRFWLSSCLEAFLRGTGKKEQLFVARGGVLAHVTNIIAISGQRASNILQTAFDLLGEMVRGNACTLQMIEDSLDETHFIMFLDVVMCNLVDSNVFLRSLYLSLESMSGQYNESKSYPSSPIKTTATSSKREITPQKHDIANVSSASSAVISNSETGRRVDEIRSRYQQVSNIVDSSSSFSELIAQGSGAIAAMGFGSDIGYISQSWYQFAPKMVIRPRTLSRLYKKIHQRDVPIASNGIPIASGSLTKKIGITHSNDNIQSATVPKTTCLSPRQDDSRTGILSAFFDGIQDSARRLLGAASTHANAVSSDSDDDNEDGGGGDDDDDDDDDDDTDYSESASMMLADLSLDDLSAVLGIDAIDAGEQLITATSSASIFVNTPSPTAKRDTVPDSKVTSTPSSMPSSRPPSAATDASMDGSMSSELGWKLPSSLTTLPQFLVRNRDRIMYKLLSNISIRNLNHENICCLNSAIIISYLAYSRGQLSKLVTGIRKLAEEEAISLTNIKAEATSEELLDSDDITIDLKVVAVSLSEVGASASNVSAVPSQDSRMSRGDQLVLNFREMLWYWKEYYLRRGRDRLSLEFSSHISFDKWIGFVDELCRDDGSPTALLSKTLVMPRSPYAYLPQCRQSCNAEIVRF